MNKKIKFLEPRLENKDDCFSFNQLSGINLTLAPDNTALLVIDVQPEYADPAGKRGTELTHQIAKKIASIVPAFREAGVPVYAFYCAEKKAKSQKNLFYIFEPKTGDLVLKKSCSSAFNKTNLAIILRKNGIQNVLHVGFNRHCCVKETALEAVREQFTAYVLSDLSGNDKQNYATEAGRKREEAAEDRQMRQSGVIFKNSPAVLENLRRIAAITAPTAKRA